MNILFLMKVFEIGGIEVVTSILSKKFIEEGNEVHIVSFTVPNPEMIQRLDKRIKIHVLRGFKISKKNIRLLRGIIIKHHINIIINQWGLPFHPIFIIKKATVNLPCKVISVYHSDPKANARILNITKQKKENKNSLYYYYYSMLKNLVSLAMRYSMRYVYKKSDIYVILSKRFTKSFIDFTKIKDLRKLRSITNPITISKEGFIYIPQNKQKKIIYVGRIENEIKRVSRVIDVWNYIEPEFPEWRLEIIGDGPDKTLLENYVKQLGLEKVSFKGFQNPKKFYEEASILLLTSEYEGFGLVVVEAMQFGVIPVVYGSYNSIYDIIDNQYNGYIINPYKNQFDTKKMAEIVKEIINNNERYKIAQNAINKSTFFSLDYVYKQWHNLFKQLIYKSE